MAGVAAILRSLPAASPPRILRSEFGKITQIKTTSISHFAHSIWRFGLTICHCGPTKRSIGSPICQIVGNTCRIGPTIRHFGLPLSHFDPPIWELVGPIPHYVPPFCRISGTKSHFSPPMRDFFGPSSHLIGTTCQFIGTIRHFVRTTRRFLPTISQIFPPLVRSDRTNQINRTTE